MRRLCFAVSILSLLGTVAFAQITPSQDAYTSSANPATNYGKAVTLGVSNNATSIQNAYVQFDLSSIPTGYTGANVAKATLKVYVNTVPGAGSFNVDYVNGTWTESTITGNLPPALGTTIVGSVPISANNVHNFLLIDVTPAVQAWLNGAQANDGIALVGNSTVNATFDSKESTTQSHPPELDVVLTGNGSGTITGVTTSSASGLTGGGTTGTLNLSLLKSCAANQILRWTGSAWACAAAGAGTVTSVGSGTGLTGGPITSSGVLSVDTTKVPLLATANTFTGNQTVNGNLSATGVVSGSSYQIGSNLFAFGSFVNSNAYLGFAGTSSGNPGVNNTGVGINALLLNTGGQNTAVGSGALLTNQVGSRNTAVGYSTINSNGVQSDNTAIGWNALSGNSTGFDNFAGGSQALDSNVAGSFNTGVGMLTLHNNGNGNNNSALGYEAGTDIAFSNLNNTTAIGALADVARSNSVVLGSINGVNGATADTNVGIGTTAPIARLQIGPTGSTNVISLRIEGPTAAGTGSLAGSFGGYGDFNIDAPGVVGGRFSVKEGGRVTIGNTATTRILTVQAGLGHPIADGWDSWSSRRWKINIHPLKGALDKIEQLRGVSYDMKELGQHQIGLIAEEVGGVVPEVVTFEKNGRDAQGVDYGRLTALLIEATKEQQALIRQQQRQIRAQQAQLKMQQVQLSRLSGKVGVLESSLRKVKETDSAPADRPSPTIVALR